MNSPHAVEEPPDPDHAVDRRDEEDRFGSAPELIGLFLVAFVSWLILTQTG